MADTPTMTGRGFIVVQAGRPDEQNLQITLEDPLFIAKENEKRIARTFPILNNEKPLLLLSDKAPGKTPYRLSYNLNIKTKGSFDLWVFENGREWSSPFRWRIDSGAWNEIASSAPMFNWTKLADDGPTFAWSRLGAVKLEAGARKLEVEITGSVKDNAKRYLFCADRFVFSPAGGGDTHQARPPFSMARENVSLDAIYLYDQDPAPGSPVQDDFRPRLEPYRVAEGKPVLGAVVIFPGGGYAARSTQEGQPVAEAFRARGFHAFVLHYRVRPHSYPAAAADAARAVRWVRKKAGSLGIHPDRIAVCGFSAGGNLAAGAGVHFDADFVRPTKDALDEVSARPDAMILIYPWIPQDVEHAQKIHYDGGDAHVAKLMCQADFARPDAPPAFFAHAADDKVVPAGDSWRLAGALGARGVSCEVHIFPTGGHGFSAGGQNPYLARWVDWCVEWLRLTWGHKQG